MRIFHFEPVSFETRSGFIHPFSSNIGSAASGYRRLWDQDESVFGGRLERPPIRTSPQEPSVRERRIPIIIEKRESNYDRSVNLPSNTEHTILPFLRDRERNRHHGQYEILVESSDESDMDLEVSLYANKNNSGYKHGKRQRPKARLSPLQPGTEDRCSGTESTYVRKEQDEDGASKHGDQPNPKFYEDYSSSSRSDNSFGNQVRKKSDGSGMLFQLIAQRNSDTSVTDHTPPKQRALVCEDPCSSSSYDSAFIKEHRSYFDLLRQRRDKNTEPSYKELHQTEKKKEEKVIVPTPSYPAYDYLKPVLRKEGRQVDYIKGDGNCFFRALSKVIFDTEHCHEETRQAVIDLIEKYPREFEQYLDDTTIHDHIVDMRKCGTWGTQTEIYAAATLLQRPIYVLSPNHLDDSYRWLLFSPRFRYSNNIEYHPCYITLCHTNGNHYDRIASLDGDCNCHLAPPSLSGVQCEVDLTEGVV